MIAPLQVMGDRLACLQRERRPCGVNSRVWGRVLPWRGVRIRYCCSREGSAVIHLLTDLPGNVIGLEASGAVTGDDYRNKIVPRIEQTQHEFEKVRMLCIFDEEFEGFTPGAAWEDSKLAFKRPG